VTGQPTPVGAVLRIPVDLIDPGPNARGAVGDVRSEDTELAITRAERDRYLDQLTDVIRERDDLAERVATLCQIAQEAADLAVDGREG
jgi:hypothetical protein